MCEGLFRSYVKRLIVTGLWICLVLSFTGQASPRPAAQEEARTEIRHLIENLYAAYSREDIDSLLSLWSLQSPQINSIKREFQQTFADNNSIEVSGLNVKEMAVDHNRAKAQVTVKVSAANGTTGKPAEGFGLINRTIEVVNEGGKWKVWLYLPAEDVALATQLLQLKTAQERDALLDREARSVTEGLVEAVIYQATELLRQNSYDQALALYDFALHVNQRVGSQKSLARILVSIGSVHLIRGNYRQAEDYSERGLRAARSAGYKSGMASALNTLASVYRRQGKLTQALDYYVESLRLLEELGDRTNVPKALNNIGLVYSRQGSLEQALEYYQKSLRLAEGIGDRSSVSSALGNIADLYLRQGDYVRSLEYVERKSQIVKELNEPRATIAALNAIGNIHLLQGNAAAARQFFEEALKIAEEFDLKELIAIASGNLATCYAVERDYAKAVELYQRELKLGEETASRGLVASGILLLGDVYAAQRNYQQALAQHQRGLALARELGNAYSIAETLKSIADDYLNLGDPQKALEYADQSAALSRQSGFQRLLWSSKSKTGRALLALNQTERARQAFVEAIAIIEDSRAQVAGGEQDQQRSFEAKTGPYLGMIQILLAQKNSAEAFSYAERAKGRVLLDVLSNKRVNIVQAMSGRELEKDQALTRELASLNTQLAQLQQQRNPDSSALSDLQARREKARSAYEAFQTELYVAHPELKIKYGEVQPVTVAEAAPLLDGKTAFLEYVVGESQTYLFVMTKDGTKNGPSAPAVLNVFQIQVGRAALSELAEGFRRRVAERDLTIKHHAQQLFDLLLAPAIPLLRGKTELCIVPDGVLWHLPFQALYQKERGYLLEQYAIYYAPSFSVLREMQHKKRATGRPASAEITDRLRTSVSNAAHEPSSASPVLLAMGNPVLSSATVAKVNGIYREEDLDPLPNAEKEVNRLGQLYGPRQSKILIRESAREDLLKAEAGHFRILHFAAHAILDDRNPMYSRILLSPSTDGAQEDGFLEAWEIARMDLAAELVVLSGCQTALGRVGAGEGMIGLSWALFIANCPAVVASQWKVDSASTAEFMIGFHRNLLQGRDGRKAPLTKAEALRQSALALLRGPYNHPAYWAGFIMVGDGR